MENSELVNTMSSEPPVLMIHVIKVESRVGSGVPGDPYRIVLQYWTPEGRLLAQKDEWLQSEEGEAYLGLRTLLGNRSIVRGEASPVDQMAGYLDQLELTNKRLLNEKQDVISLSADLLETLNVEWDEENHNPFQVLAAYVEGLPVEEDTVAETSEDTKVFQLGETPPLTFEDVDFSEWREGGLVRNVKTGEVAVVMEKSVGGSGNYRMSLSTGVTVTEEESEDWFFQTNYNELAED